MYNGQEKRISAQFYVGQVKAFASDTKDFNSLHLDPLFVRKTSLLRRFYEERDVPSSIRCCSSLHFIL